MAGIHKNRAGTLFALVAATVGIVLAGPVQGTGTNLITNGSFELPDIPFGSFAIYPSGAVPGWSHEPRPGTTSAGIEVQDHRSGDPDPSAGDQFAVLDSDGPSKIYQDIATSPGSAYELSFLYSAAPNTSAAQNHFNVSAGDSSVEIGPLSSASTTVWVPYTIDFVATDATTRIAFLDLGPEESPGNGLGAYLDLVSVVEIVNTPPDCSAVAPDRTTLEPPNRQFHTITLSGATDAEGPITLTVTGATQDEAVGNTPDAALGVTADQVQLRAERDGSGDGRVYRIAFTASDGDGATCSGTAIVSIPHHPGSGPAVDSGASHDSFGSPSP